MILIELMKENFKEFFYIAALPDLSLSFYQRLEKLHELSCYPEFRLPFHVTLFYLGELNDEEKNRVFNWFDDKKELPSMEATVKGIESFYTDKNPFVYFLELESSDLYDIHEKLSIFSDIHKDDFSFVPHLSLFFPKLSLTQSDHNFIKEIFKDLEKISFKKIYLGSVIDNVTRIHKILPCRE